MDYQVGDIVEVVDNQVCGGSRPDGKCKHGYDVQCIGETGTVIKFDGMGHVLVSKDGTTSHVPPYCCKYKFSDVTLRADITHY